MKKLDTEIFFDETEMGFYKNYKDLGNKIEKLLMSPKMINSYAKNGKQRYFELFNNKKISKNIIDKTFI